MTSIWINDVTVGEQDRVAKFMIRLDAAATAPVTVNYTTVSSTATSTYNADFVCDSGTLTFNVGDIEKTVLVQLTDDAIEEGTEVFTMNLSTPAPTRRSRAPSERPRSSTMTRPRARRRSRSATSQSTRRQGRRTSSSPSTGRAPAWCR